MPRRRIPYRRCQSSIFVNFGRRGKSQKHYKKDRLLKDCFISEISGTQPYMQIPSQRYIKSIDFAPKTVNSQIGGAEYPTLFV